MSDTGRRRLVSGPTSAALGTATAALIGGGLAVLLAAGAVVRIGGADSLGLVLALTSAATLVVGVLVGVAAAWQTAREQRAGYTLARDTDDRLDVVDATGRVIAPAAIAQEATDPAASITDGSWMRPLELTRTAPAWLKAARTAAVALVVLGVPAAILGGSGDDDPTALQVTLLIAGILGIVLGVIWLFMDVVGVSPALRASSGARSLRILFPGAFVTTVLAGPDFDMNVARALQRDSRADGADVLMLGPAQASWWAASGGSLRCILTVPRDRVLRRRQDLIDGPVNSGWTIGEVWTIRLDNGRSTDLPFGASAFRGRRRVAAALRAW